MHGGGANFAFGHSCELESPKLKAGPWCLDLRRLGRRAAEIEPRARGARGLGFKLDPPWPSVPYGFGCGSSVGFRTYVVSLANCTAGQRI